MNDLKFNLHHGDCLDVMRDIPEVDAVITDPPYGTTACSWDAVIPFDSMWDNIHEVSKPNSAIALFGSQPFTTALITSNIEMFKYCWVWKKSKGGNFVHAPNMPLLVTEDIVVFSRGAIAHANQSTRRMTYYPQGTRPGKTTVKQNPNTSEHKYHRESQSQHKSGYKCKNENYPNTLLDFASASNGAHPTQKPVSLMKYLILTYTNAGETVLDFTMGSGTTGVACAELGRKFIGIEIDKDYFEIARKRIETSYSQEIMF